MPNLIHNYKHSLIHFVLYWFVYNRGKAFCFGRDINSTELNSTFETNPCHSRATVEPAWYGSSTTFETGISDLKLIVTTINVQLLRLLSPVSTRPVVLGSDKPPKR